MSNETKLQKLLTKLSSSNASKSIKLRTKDLKGGGFSIYLDHYHNGKRTFHFPKIYLYEDKPFDNEENVRKAIAFRDRMESEIVDQRLGLPIANWKRRSSFLDYFQALGIKKNHKRWHAAFLHLNNYTNGKCSFADIDVKWVEGFKDYLIGVRHINTAWAYLGNVKVALNQAVKDGILTDSPARNVNIKRRHEHREYLTVAEVQTIAKTPCFNPIVKDAFLFGCYTGLRLSDIEGLTWENVKDGYLTIRQVKTDDPLRNALSRPALEILSRQDTGRKYVFNLPSRSTITRDLVRWLQDAGINKPIKFHGSRHTYAIILLSEGKVDLFTVSKMLGHMDIKTTQIYAQVVDSMKDEATRRFSAVWDEEV